MIKASGWGTLEAGKLITIARKMSFLASFGVCSSFNAFLLALALRIESYSD